MAEFQILGRRAGINNLTTHSDALYLAPVHTSEFYTGLGMAAASFSFNMNDRLGLRNNDKYRDLKNGNCTGFEEIYSMERSLAIVDNRTSYFDEKLGGMRADREQRLEGLCKLIQRDQEYCTSSVLLRRSTGGAQHYLPYVDLIHVLKYIVYSITIMTKDGEMTFLNSHVRRRTLRILRAIEDYCKHENLLIDDPSGDRRWHLHDDENGRKAGYRRDLGTLSRFVRWQCLCIEQGAKTTCASAA